jgi:hypothetical protein
MFKGRQVALGISDRRLLVQGGGPLGNFGGGETQRQGVAALAAWFSAAGRDA